MPSYIAKIQGKAFNDRPKEAKSIPNKRVDLYASNLGDASMF
jgi:hypothetical protein